MYANIKYLLKLDATADSVRPFCKFQSHFDSYTESSVSTSNCKRLDKTSWISVDEEDLKQILNRYAEYDSSDKGINGIDTNIMLSMPEIAMNPLLIRLVHLVKDTHTNRVHPKGFVKFFGYLSSKTPMTAKKTGKATVYFNSFKPMN